MVWSEVPNDMDMQGSVDVWMCVWGWHVVPMDGIQEAYGWCVVEVKSPLGKGEWVGLVHGQQRGLESHREVETHTWEGNCWVTRVSEVPHWIKMRRMIDYYDIIEHILIGFRHFGLKCLYMLY